MFEDYLQTSRIAVELLKEPVIEERWKEPSALAGFTVGGLAEHLAGQVLLISMALSRPVPPDIEVISLYDHYGRSAWANTDLESTANVGIRQRAEDASSEGHAGLVSRAEEGLAELRSTLAGLPGDRVVHLFWAGWGLTLDDLLATRLLEIVVHLDDLAVSVGLPTPEAPAAVAQRVVDLLSRLAVRRHGPTAVVRALSRSERAPATVSAF